MLTCRELTELVTDYSEGRLRLKEKLEVQLHLGMCRHCRAYFRQMRATVETLGEMPPEAMPDPARDALLARFRTMSRFQAPNVVAIREPRWLKKLELAAQSRRAWVLLTIVAIATIAGGLLFGSRAELLGPACALVELATGGAPALGVAWIASRRGRKAPAAALGLVAAWGASVGLLALTLLCGCDRVTHVLTYHVGGFALAVLASLPLARLPVRSRPT